MKSFACFFIGLFLILVSAVAGGAQEEGWPRQRTVNGNTLVIYQPQIDQWKDFRELQCRMAIAFTPAGGKTVVGVVELHGQTIVDNDKQVILIADLKINKTYFPSLDPSVAAQVEPQVRKFLPPSVTMELQRFAALVPKQAANPGVELKNNPPVIFVTYKPAILLDVDGPPVRGQIPNTNLEYIVNTHWPLFFDPQGNQFYLLAGDQWLTAPALQGPWAGTRKLPRDMNEVAGQTEWQDLKKFIPPPANRNSAPPAVFYSTGPAEVILFNGKPVYTQIPGTGLKYATNTESYLFLHTPTNRYYYLTAGRWFSADSLGGPWTFATPSLPADFARIPRFTPAAQVLPSVPGTEEAKDAVLLAQVPTTVVVNPATAEASAKVTYAGSPQFVPIEGTTLYYAKNTSQPVIRVGDLYYLCLQGIWFVSPNPLGPWQTATAVPQVIYTIPPSSPVYNVTYVTQVTTDGVVQASYTAGYMGAFVMGMTTGAIIACGTGFYYPPFVAVYPGYHYPVYYPRPYTYGYMTHYYTPTGAYGVAQTAYGPYGSATRTASYNPYTGTYARTASVSTPYGTAAAGRAYNPYTGAAGATRQGSNPYASWGSSVVTKGGQTAYTQHYSTAQRTTATAETSGGGRSAATTGRGGTTTATKTGSGDLYASHDGNVYKNTGSGWEKYDNGNWNRVEKPTPPSSSAAPSATAQQRAQSAGVSRESVQQQAQERGGGSVQYGGGSQQMQNLQQEAQNRERGAQSSQRYQSFQQSGGAGSRSWGGGGFSRGGGRR
jgi:hypothetical protein